jgi:arylsulfatase A-like enzyme
VQWEGSMAEMLAAAGCATAMFGKWHLGNTSGRFPTYQGFDEWYGVDSTDDSAYTSLHGFKESRLPEAFVFDGRKGEEPKKARPYNHE